MKATYKLQLKQHQRRLNLTYKELNRYDRKHNDINLIKYLQSLNPKEDDSDSEGEEGTGSEGEEGTGSEGEEGTGSEGEEGTGFYGSFEVTNQREPESEPKFMVANLAFNGVVLTSSVQINSDDTFTFTIDIQDRLPLPSSILELMVTFQSDTSNVAAPVVEGFTITELTNNDLDNENIMSLLVDAGNYDNGSCNITFVLTSG